MQTLSETGLADDTILVFTADHGDMLGSQGMQRKQKPYDESIRVPMLLRWPKGGVKTGKLEAPINTEDIMPTLLGLSGVAIPRASKASITAAICAAAPIPPAARPSSSARVRSANGRGSGAARNTAACAPRVTLSCAT